MIGAKYQTWRRKTERHKNSAADIAHCDRCDRTGKTVNVLASVRVDSSLRVVRARLCRFCRKGDWRPEDYERVGRLTVNTFKDAA